MERPDEAPLIDRDLWHEHGRTHTGGRDNMRSQHVSVNTSGGYMLHTEKNNYGGGCYSIEAFANTTINTKRL